MHKAPSIVLFNLYKHVCGEKIVGTELKAAFGKEMSLVQFSLLSCFCGNIFV